MSDYLIKLYDNKIYGSGYTDPNFSLIGADSKDHFLNALNTQPNNWIYRTKSVEYKRNSCGHRCKELTELNDFILFIGCSLTEGVGLAEEDTYYYQLSKILNLDYYNLGLAGSGPDLLVENLSMWFNNIRRMPKLLVIQWPSPNRFYKKFSKGLTPVGAWIAERYDSVSDEVKKGTKYDFVDKKVIHQFVEAAEAGYFEHYNSVLQNIAHNYLKNIGINFIEFTDEEFPKLDVARDLIHPGILSHGKLVENLLEKVKK